MISASYHRSRQLRSSQFNGKYVLYWMIRDRRVHDNWALLEAQKVAIEQKVPLLVCFQFIGSYKKANINFFLGKNLQKCSTLILSSVDHFLKIVLRKIYAFAIILLTFVLIQIFCIFTRQLAQIITICEL